MNNIHAAIVEIARELFPAQSEASYETLIAGLTTREQSFRRLSDLMQVWSNQQSPETDIATVHPQDNHESAELTPGMYRDAKSGAIFKVQTSQAGRLYAKELEAGHFEYSRGAIFRIKPEWRMTLEDMQAYGVETGACIVCQRELTVPESIARGMGPICYGKYA